jgi:predicted negative regulator of RcsB-dependent stress response
MANENVFEKEYEDQRDRNNLEGVLEQFNVPPKAITFIRKNLRLLQVAIAVAILGVVAWALYDSYRQTKIENSESALAQALELEGEQQVAALEQVAMEFSGTDSALWAEVSVARELARLGRTEEAQATFTTLLSRVEKKSALKPLIEFSAAQTSEALGDYAAAAQMFESLKNVEGYQGIAYGGLGRLRELQGDMAGALQVYEEQLGALSGSANASETAHVEEKIARIKASL